MDFGRGFDSRRLHQSLISDRLCPEVLRFAQDFACGLRRPQCGSSSTPAAYAKFPPITFLAPSWSSHRQSPKRLIFATVWLPMKESSVFDMGDRR
jgi:hypothetical protein